MSKETSTLNPGARPALWRRVVRPFHTLEYRDFRLLWFGNLANSSIMWMEIVTRNWLMWEITGSLLGVGTINFVRWLPSMVLALPAGVLTDRVDRKALLVGSQALILVLYALLAFLAWTDVLGLWHLYTIFALLGTASTFSQPARQSLVAQSVPKEELTNAISLQQLAFNGTRLGGPVLSGLIMAEWGSTPVFALLALGSAVSVAVTVNLRLPSTALPAVTSPFASAVEGLKYVWGASVLRLLVVLSFLVMFLALPFSTLLPGFAQEVFGMGAGGFGVMMSASGAGALLATLLLASVNVQRPIAVTVLSAILFGAVLIWFAYTPWLAAALVVLGISGVMNGVYGILSNSMLLSQSDPSYHGRLMSLFMLNHSFMPIGALPAGWIADRFGPSAAMALMGVALIVAVALVAAAHPSVVALRVQAAQPQRPVPSR
ncbi:MAG: MFS transporter [Dehalococcoidia bacterium]|nr:MFS transporter [Dehalococcoidia bacterium]